MAMAMWDPTNYKVSSELWSLTRKARRILKSKLEEISEAEMGLSGRIVFSMGQAWVWALGPLKRGETFQSAEIRMATLSHDVTGAALCCVEWGVAGAEATAADAKWCHVTFLLRCVWSLHSLASASLFSLQDKSSSFPITHCFLYVSFSVPLTKQ